MTYEAWRISYQSSEQAARAAYAECVQLRAKIAEMERQEPAKYERRIKLRSKHDWGAWWECDKGDYVKAKAAGGHYPKFSDDLLDYEMRPLYTLPGAQAQPAPSVPDGWQLVPVEPTEEMIYKVIDERLAALVSGKDHSLLDIYRAMLAASPKAKP